MAKGKSKTNNKKGPVKSKLNYSRPTQDSRSGIGQKAPTGHLAQTHALTHPWSKAARGSKIPDDDSTRSVSYQQRFTVPIPVVTGGFGGCIVRPNPTSGTVWTAATADATGILTWSGPFTDPDVAQITAAADTYRIVSFGVRVYSLLAPTAQSGYIKVMTTPSIVSTAAPFLTSGGLFERVETFPTANSDIHWISSPVGTTWKEYLPIGTIASYENVAIYLAGLPVSSTAMQLELIYNLELQAKPGDLTSALATNALAHNPTALAAASHVHAKKVTPLNASTTTVGSMLKRMAVQGLHSVASYMLPVGGDILSRAIFGSGRKQHNRLGNIEEVD